MFDIFKSRLEISGILTTVTALRISQGRSTEPIGSDLPVVKDSLGKPFIPGSSFKGALRSRLESFLRGILGSDRKLVANPAIEEEWALTSKESQTLKKMTLDELTRFCWFIDLSKEEVPAQDDWQDFLTLSFARLSRLIRFKSDLEAGKSLSSAADLEHSEDLDHIDKFPESQALEELKKQYQPYDAALTKAMVSETDLASQLFGSPWISSKFQIRDLTVLPDTWFGQYQERDGVSIDRDTETAADGKLYDFQVVPAGTPFVFKAVVENAEDWELGLLMIGLHQFENKMIPLGGGCSRGLGVVKLELNEMIWVKPENPQDLINYLKNLVDGQLQAYVKTSGEIATLKNSWSQKTLEKLTQLAAREATHA